MLADFLGFPLPDSPIGLHGPSTVGSLDYPKQFGSLENWMRHLRDQMGMGLYCALLEPGFSVLRAVEAAATPGMLVIVRPQPDGGEPHPRMQLNPPNVRRLRDAGASYIQLGNEPDNKGEWVRGDGGVQHGRMFIEALGNQIMEMASKAISVGMPVLLPPMNAGYPSFDRNGIITDGGAERVSHKNFFLWAIQTNNLDQLIAWAAAGKLAVAVHNRPANHFPPEYPNDPVCLADPEYFQNVLGIYDPVRRLENDGTSFDSYKNIDALNRKYLGRAVPLFGTEAGYTCEVADDNRYPKIKDDPDVRDRARELGHAEANIELLARFWPDHPNRHDPELAGLCFYHGLYGGDSFVEAWWENKLYGRNLAITRLLPEWWKTHARSFADWRDRWFSGSTDPAAPTPDPEPEPEPPIVVPVDPTPLPGIPVTGDPFGAATITDWHGTARDLAWLRDTYGDKLIATVDPAKWTITGIWETHGPMAVIFDIERPDGAAIEGVTLQFGWPTGSVPITTNADGLTDFPLSSDGYYNPDNAGGPYYAEADGLRIDGIGWLSGTEHDHVNFALTKGARVGGPTNPPTEPEPPIIVPPTVPSGPRRRIFGSHIQYATNDAVESTERERGIGVKTMDSSLEPIRRLLDREPNGIVIVRHFFHLSEQAEYRQQHLAGAKTVVDRVAGNFNQIISYCHARNVPVFAEGLNEPDPNPHSELARLSDWYAEFARLCAARGLRPLAYSWGTGNPPSYGWGPGHPAGFNTYFESLIAQWKVLRIGLEACVHAGGGGAWHTYDWPGWLSDPYWQGLRFLNDLDAIASFDPQLAEMTRVFLTEVSIDVGIKPEYVRDAGERKGWRTALKEDQNVLVKQAMDWRGGILRSRWGRNVVIATPFTRGPQADWLDYSFDNLPIWEQAIANEGANDMPKTPKQTTITALNTPGGHPGETVEFQFRASGVDGQAKGFADVEYPLIPGTSQDYYGPNETIELAPFSDGTHTVDVEIGPTSQALPGPIVGEIRIRITEIEGRPDDLTFDGGEFGPFPITIIPRTVSPETPTGNPPNVGPGRLSPKDALDQLWALGSAFGQNGAKDHESYIHSRVIVLKDALKL